MREAIHKPGESGSLFLVSWFPNRLLPPVSQWAMSVICRLESRAVAPHLAPAANPDRGVFVM
jgi:hypothetical protein